MPDVSSIVVHELGHHLLDVYSAKKFGFEGCYVSEENADVYLNGGNAADASKAIVKSVRRVSTGKNEFDIIRQWEDNRGK